MRFVFIMLCLIATFFSFSQADSLHVSRFLPKKFGVYPYKAEITKSEYELNKELQKYPYMEDESGKVSRNPNYVDSLKKYRLKNFNALFQLNLSFETIYKHNDLFNEEIPPFIDTVPDGIYVRYFKAYPYTDEDTIKFDKYRISTIFSIKNNIAEGMSYWFILNDQLCYKYGNYESGKKMGVWKFDYTDYKEQKRSECIKIFSHNIEYYSITDTIISSFYFSNSSGKHVVKFLDYGYHFEFYYDSICLNRFTDSIWELYRWKIKPDDKRFISRSSNLVLVEKFKPGKNVYAEKSNYLDRDGAIFLNWRDKIANEYEIGFSYFRQIDSYFFNDFTRSIDRYSNDDSSPANRFDYSYYESNYSNGDPFIRYNYFNEKEDLQIYRENKRLYFSKKQLSNDELARVSKSHFDSVKNKVYIHFQEIEYNEKGNIKSSFVYSYVRDSLTNSLLCDNNYYPSKVYPFVLKTDLINPSILIIEKLPFYKVENEENKEVDNYQYIRDFTGYSFEKTDTFFLVRANYNLKKGLITEKNYFNFDRKEIKIKKTISELLSSEINIKYIKGTFKWYYKMFHGSDLRILTDTVSYEIDTISERDDYMGTFDFKSFLDINLIE